MNVAIENLTKEYDGKTVLNIDDFIIKKGSLCGIVGQNGAGKSTLIRIVAGLEKSSQGQVFYGKEKQTNFQDVSREITLVFQKPYLLRTTVEKNIAYPLKMRGWEQLKIEKRVNELMEELGLKDKAKQKAWKLSGGETQKVALARALSFYPALLLLDEPTANVDPGTVEEIEKILKKMNQEHGTTIVMITHNLQQLKRLCTQMIFMNLGKIVESGNTDVILKKPSEPLTKKFIQGELIL